MYYPTIELHIPEFIFSLCLTCRLLPDMYSPTNGHNRRQTQTSPTLLLHRGVRARRRQAPHRPSNLSWHRRARRPTGPRPHRPTPFIHHHPRSWLAGSPLARRSAVWSLGSARIALGETALRSLHSALSAAGRDSAHLPAGAENRSGGLVSPLHSFFTLGFPGRAVHLAGILGCL